MPEQHEHLAINGRPKLPTSAFEDAHKLYRGYAMDDLDEEERIKIETVRFPDFSCNWSLFSEPADIRHRPNASPSDGCYSFTVATARYKSMATPVHDPLAAPMENYAHVEVRTLREGESVQDEPDKGRKLRSASKKLEYRQNLLNSIHIELAAE